MFYLESVYQEKTLAHWVVLSQQQVGYTPILHM